MAMQHTEDVHFFPKSAVYEKKVFLKSIKWLWTSSGWCVSPDSVRRLSSWCFWCCFLEALLIRFRCFEAAWDSLGFFGQLSDCLLGFALGRTPGSSAILWNQFRRSNVFGAKINRLHRWTLALQKIVGQLPGIRLLIGRSQFLRGWMFHFRMVRFTM